MLNLNKIVSYTQEQEEHVQHLLAKLGKTIVIDGKTKTIDGPYLWGRGDTLTYSIKHRLSVHTLRFQGGRCAFCESLLREGDVPIEHIVPKSKHGEYSFTPLNIVTSCTSCNSTIKKGDKDTVYLPLAGKYEDNQFKIVHPYLDDPDAHIKYKDSEKIELDTANCSPKGLWTIELFHWDTPLEFKHRVIVSKSRELDPPSLQEILLISTYK